MAFPIGKETGNERDRGRIYVRWDDEGDGTGWDEVRRARRLTFGARTTGTARLAGEVMLHAAHRCARERSVSVARLMRLLWKVEMRCYLEFGLPLTGSRYLACEDGPVLDGIDALVSRLVESGAIEREVAGGEPALRALREPDLTRFSSYQLEVIDRVLDENRDKSDEVLMEETKGLPWRCSQANRGLDGPIPYELQIIRDEPPTEQDRAIARFLFEKHGFGVTV